MNSLVSVLQAIAVVIVIVAIWLSVPIIVAVLVTGFCVMVVYYMIKDYRQYKEEQDE